MLASVSWSVVCAYAGDALWVIALTIMFSASRAAWCADRGPGQRAASWAARRRARSALWLLPAASLRGQPLARAAGPRSGDEAALIVFGVRAARRPLLALLHLRWLASPARLDGR